MRLLKTLSILAAGLLLLLTLLISLIPLDSYLAQTEQTLSAQLGAPMQIRQLRLGALPWPHLILQNARLGADDEHITAATVEIRPDWSALIHGNFVIKRIHLHEGSAHATQISKLVSHLSAAPSGGGNFELQALGFSEMRLLLADQTLDSVEGDLRFAADGKLEHAWFGLDGRKLTAVLLAKKAAGFNLKLQASEWTPALAPQLTLKNLKVDGDLSISDSRPRFSGNIKLGQLATKLIFSERDALLSLEQIETGIVLSPQEIMLQPLTANFFGGTLSGNIQFNRTSARVSGNLHSENVALEPLMQQLFNQSRFSGNLESTIDFSLPTKTDQPLHEGLEFGAQYTIRNGVLKDIDLVEAAKNPGEDKNVTGSTAFDTLSGLVKGDASGYHFEPVQIASGLLDAQGGVSMSHELALAGWLDVDVKNTVGLVSMPMNISGTLSEPVIRPSKSAIAGAAVGTAVLGPLGTALGVKIGGFINRHMNNTPKQKPVRPQAAPQ